MRHHPTAIGDEDFFENNMPGKEDRRIIATI